MNETPAEVEAYVLTDNVSAIVRLVETVTGVLREDETTMGVLRRYSNTDVVAFLQPAEAGYTSIRLNGHLPWPSSPALGRFLSARLHCTVRCDPEDEFPEVSPYSDVFLEIDEAGERLVQWV